MSNKNLIKKVGELKFKHAVTKISNDLEVSKGTVSSYLNGKIPASDNFLQKFANFYNVDLNSITDQDNRVGEPQTDYEVSKRVPFFDIDVTASNIESFPVGHELAEYDIDFKPFNDCIAMLPVVGDSMYPEYKNGDIIAIKEAPTTHFVYGETHLIITREGYRTVKKIRKHKDDSKIILKPVNPNYDEEELDKSAIVKLYLVKGQFKTHTY